MNYERRQQATARYAATTAAINPTFDAHDNLRAAVSAVRTATDLADPIVAVAELATLQRSLKESLAALKAAALTAAAYRPEAEIAKDLDTKTANLFPRDTADSAS